MKAANWFLLSILLVVAATLSECTVQKRIYRNGYYVSWKKKAVEPSHPIQVVETKKTIQLKNKIQTTQVVRRDKTSEYFLASADEDLVTNTKALVFQALPLLADSCGDLIMLRDGSEIMAKVMEVNPNSVKYKLCDNLNGPMIVTNVEKVFMIRYVNGSKEVFHQNNNRQIPQENTSTLPARSYPTQELKTNDWAIASFVVSLFSWLFIPAIVSVILGAIGISQIEKHPDQYKGKGLATAGIIISLLVLFIFFMAIAL